MTLSMSTRLERAARIRFRHIAGETVVLDQQNRRILVLNEVGGRLLDLIDGRRSLADVAGVISEEFDAAGADVRADVLGFAQALTEKGLARLVETGPSA